MILLNCVLSTSSDFEVGFIMMPMIMSTMEMSHFTIVLFYTIMLFLGFSSIIMYGKTITDGISYMIPSRQPKFYDNFIVCFGIFLITLPMCSGSGYYYYNTLKKSCCIWTVLVLFLEVISIGWVYGITRYLHDVRYMRKYCLISNTKKCNICWKIHFTFLLPAIVFALFISTMYDEVSNGFSVIIQRYPIITDTTIEVPDWCNNLGIVVKIAVFSPIVVLPAIYLYRDREGSFRERLDRLVTPTELWGPKKQSDYMRGKGRERRNCIVENEDTSRGSTGLSPSTTSKATCERKSTRVPTAGSKCGSVPVLIPS